MTTDLPPTVMSHASSRRAGDPGPAPSAFGPDRLLVLERIADLAQALGVARDLVTVYRALRDFVMATTPTHGIFVSRYEPEHARRIAVYASTDVEEIDVSTLPPMPMTDSPHSRAVTTGEIIVHDDLQAAMGGLPHVNVGMTRDPRLPQSSLAAPMSVGGRVVGGFEVQSVELAAYTPDDVAAMRLAANLAAIATENVRLLGEERRQRRLAEASETRLHELVQGLEAIVFEIDPVAGTVTFISRQLETILGHPPERALGPLDRLVGLIDPGDRERATDAFRAAIAEQGDLDIEVRFTAADGRTVWIHAVARAAGTGPGTRMRGVAVDVSERRHLEERLMAAHKMEAIGQLAGGVAHDFNNLLTAIRGSAQLLLADLASDDSRRIDAEAILDAADRGSALVRQLLAFGRRQHLQPTIVDLRALIEDMTPVLQRLIGEDTALRLVAAGELGRVRADRAQLQQVLLNLVVNARDAMPDGGDVTIETADAVLGRDYTRLHPEVEEGRYVMVAVHDTGVGIDHETMQHLFEPFFTTKEAAAGSGLGLATVYGIVSQSGGHVSVESEPGRGTTFRVYFPHVSQPATHVPAADRPTAPERGNETILVVEDEEAVRVLTRRILEGLGYRVRSAASGADAVEWLEGGGEPIDLLITDVVMPGMQGPDLAVRVRALRPSTKVLFVSGYTGRPLDQQGIGTDGPALLEKPFSAASLGRAVRAALEGIR